MQDLAISPGIRDPTLNTAECVIQGHQPSIDATGVSYYIRAILYCSLFSVLLIGPILGFFSLNFLRNDPKKKDKFKRCAKRQRDRAPAQDRAQERDRTPEQDRAQEQDRAPVQEPTSILCRYDCCCCCNERFFECYKIEDPFMRPAKYICHLLVMTEISVIIVISDALWDYEEIYIPIVLIICEGVVVCSVQCFPKLCCVFGENSRKTSFYRRAIFLTSANIITYHVIWLIVGIMVNPTWGLTVLAVACFVIVALLCTIHLICSASQKSFCRSFCVSIASFLGLGLVVSLTVLAGQSFYGKETTGEILKTSLWYVVGGLTGLLGKGYLGSSSNKDCATRTDNEIELEDMNDVDGEGTGEDAEEEERGRLLQP